MSERLSVPPDHLTPLKVLLGLEPVQLIDLVILQLHFLLPLPLNIFVMECCASVDDLKNIVAAGAGQCGQRERRHGRQDPSVRSHNWNA